MFSFAVDLFHFRELVICSFFQTESRQYCLVSICLFQGFNIEGDVVTAAEVNVFDATRIQ